jgi:uncharacterized protein
MIGELSEREAKGFLSQCRFGSLGCFVGSEIYVVPISFALDGNRIIGQTKLGRKVEMMRQNPHVCLEAHQVESIAEWRSVIAWGRFEELHGAEAVEAMGKLIDHFEELVEEVDGNRSLREVTPRRLDHSPQVDLVYCIHLDKITGRYEAQSVGG